MTDDLLVVLGVHMNTTHVAVEHLKRQAPQPSTTGRGSEPKRWGIEET